MVHLYRGDMHMRKIITEQNISKLDIAEYRTIRLEELLEKVE